jgi:hypothetical protein
MTPEMEPDWLDIPSQVALTKMKLEEYRQWISENLAKGSWTVLQFHGIEGDIMGWQPLSKQIFIPFLDELAGKQKDLWIAPFAEVGAYWRAQKILENAAFRQEDSKTIFHWEKPKLFPGGVFLKIKANSGRFFQYGQALQKGSDGSSLVSFDAKELSIHRMED